MKNNKKPFIIGGIVALVLAIVSIVLVIFNLNASNNPTLKKFENNTTVKEIVEVATVENSPVSTITVAPATNDWWKNVIHLSNRPELLSLDVENKAKDAMYVASTLSPGTQYVEYSQVGMYSLYIVFEDSETAANTYLTMQEDAQGLTFEHYGNMVVFPAPGSLSDVDLAIDRIEANKEIIAEENLVEDNEAIMLIKAQDYVNIYAGLTNRPKDTETVEAFFNKFGITEETVWAGTSKDGLEWNGKLHNLDYDSVSSPHEVSDLINDTSEYLTTDDKLVPYEEITNTNFSGESFPRQSIVFYYEALAIRNNVQSIDYSYGDLQGPFLPKDEGLFQVKILPTLFTASMLDRDTWNIYSAVDEATFTIKDGFGNSTINFSFIEGDDYDYWVEYYSVLAGVKERTLFEEVPDESTGEEVVMENQPLE